MKAEIHPAVYPVLFVDGDHQWTGVSTMKTGQTKEVDGVSYYVVNVDISAFSHPFYTGQKKLVDTAGRVEKFMRRYGQQMSTEDRKKS
jgi:large subunit ribosomal protein L31